MSLPTSALHTRETPYRPSLVLNVEDRFPPLSAAEAHDLFSPENELWDMWQIMKDRRSAIPHSCGARWPTSPATRSQKMLPLVRDPASIRLIRGPPVELLIPRSTGRRPLRGRHSRSAREPSVTTAGQPFRLFVCLPGECLRQLHLSPLDVLAEAHDRQAHDVG